MASRKRRSPARLRVGKVSIYLHHGAWWLYYREHGKQVRRKVGEARDEAEQVAAQVNAQLTQGAPTLVAFTPVAVPELRLRFLDYHEQVLRSSVGTVRRYRAATQHLEDFVAQQSCPPQAHEVRPDGNRHQKGKHDRHQKGNTGGVRLVRFSLPGVFVFLRLHRLPEAITFAVHLENVALVCEPIKQRRRHPFALEHLSPLAERQVAGDQKAASLVAVGEDLEEQLGTGTAERQVAQLVHGQKVKAVQGGQEAVETMLLLSDFEKADQLGGGDELDPLAEPAQGQSQGNGQVRLAGSRAADQTAVEVLLDPFAACQLKDFVLGEVGRGGEVEGVEVLEGRKAGGADSGRDGVGRSGGHFQLGELEKVGVVGLVAVGGLTRQFLPLGQHRRQPQLLEIGFEHQGIGVVHVYQLLLRNGTVTDRTGTGRGAEPRHWGSLMRN